MIVVDWWSLNLIVMFVCCSAQVDTDSPGNREAHTEVQRSAVVSDHGER